MLKKEIREEFKKEFDKKLIKISSALIEDGISCIMRMGELLIDCGKKYPLLKLETRFTEMPKKLCVKYSNTCFKTIKDVTETIKKSTISNDNYETEVIDTWKACAQIHNEFCEKTSNILIENNLPINERRFLLSEIVENELNK